METSDARLGEETGMYHSLSSLPEPYEPVVAAVYNFKDHTGQYKPSETGASWSTAVTQGSTTILMRALEESKWFVPIERENLSNLLNERKIIRSSRSQYEDNPAPLPPLLFAGVILEGGIISYESNIITGGAGLRYFGAGGSGQYRQDKVTVYLRAVSTSTGKILKTVYTSKTLLSQSVDVGLFRFVSFKKLLEFETGFTYNEPSDMAVTEAIEKAVEALIIEGTSEGYWQLGNPADTSNVIFQNYWEEKEINKDRDFFGQATKFKNVWSLTAAGGAWLYEGDYFNSQIKPAGSLNLEYKFKPNVGISLNNTYGSIGAASIFNSSYIASDLGVNFYMFPYDKFSPFLRVGGGLLYEADNSLGEIPQNRIFPKLSATAGIEYELGDKVSLMLSGSYQYVFDDGLDGKIQGIRNDAIIAGDIGVKYYFLRNVKKIKEDTKPKIKE